MDDDRKKKGLGRGLMSLFGDEVKPSKNSEEINSG